MFLAIISLSLVIASGISIFIAIRSESKWMRLLGYLMVSSKISMLIIIFAAWSENSFYLDIALVYILLGYIGALVLSNYMASQRDRDAVATDTVTAELEESK